MRFIFIVIVLFFIGCGNKEKEPGSNDQGNTGNNSEEKYEINSIGIGPVKKVELGPINQNLVQQGEQIFNSKCIACHTLDEKRLGPPLGKAAQKLRPEFIMNYLLNTNEMQEKDEYLKSLIQQYHIVMPDQNLTESEARGILEYLRSASKK